MALLGNIDRRGEITTRIRLGGGTQSLGGGGPQSLGGGGTHHSLGGGPNFDPHQGTASRLDFPSLKK